ncbi:hypothetical protein Tco_0587375, partial [Tanacetum coccineum]
MSDSEDSTVTYTEVSSLLDEDKDEDEEEEHPAPADSVSPPAYCTTARISIPAQ